MKLNDSTSTTPGLLVSVRSAGEALAALAGGADVIDVKEPNRGPLGGADTATIRDVVDAVDGRAIVTAAMGELVDHIDVDGDEDGALPEGVSLFKLGLASCSLLPNWQAAWRGKIESLSVDRASRARQFAASTNGHGLASHSNQQSPQPVAVVYADWREAAAPSPDDVLDAAVRFKCAALLIDTWNKSAGSLFDLWPVDELKVFLLRVRSEDVPFVLAGSLSGDSFRAAAELGPALVAVRGAACDTGRSGTVSSNRVAKLKVQLEALACPPAI